MNEKAITTAVEQAKIDFPTYQTYRGSFLASENVRVFVKVFMNRVNGERLQLRPSPVVLYAVSVDCEAAWRVPNTDGAVHGFHPERRR
jgi:hypothetical protein